MAGFEFLEYTNSWLKAIPGAINKSIKAYIKDGENISQSRVDTICAWLAWKVNITVERERQKVLKALYGMYQNTMIGRVMQMAVAIKAFVSDPWGQVKKYAGMVATPISYVFDWLTTLTIEVPKLGNNLANIIKALPPSPPPGINFKKFKLKIGTIDIAAILQNPYSLPSPEAMFPEPEKPWTSAVFDEDMNPETPIEKAIFYELPDENEVQKAIREASQ